MPLYNIPKSTHHLARGEYMDYTEEEKRIIMMDIRSNFRRNPFPNKMIPAIYVSTSVFFNIIMDSSEFQLYNVKKENGNKIGSYDGVGTLYLSQDLEDNEYYIGIESEDILQYKRMNKLNNIKQKLCGHITEEKQR